MTAKAKETEKAKAAYQIYEGLGPGRTILKAAEAYGKDWGKTGANLKSLAKVLEGWSAKWGWQARVAAYEEKFRAKQQTAAEKARLENLGLVRAAKVRLAESLKGKTFKADTTADMERLVKLEMQLLGEPLADKHEHSGEVTVKHGHLSDVELAGLAAQVAAAGGDGSTGDD